MGPIAVILLVAAVAAAFLRARFEQQARLNRTTKPAEGMRGKLPRASERLVYTEEGQRYRKRARVFRGLLLLFGLGAILATWLGW